MNQPETNPRTFGEELLNMVFDSRRRAQVRTRLMRRLDEQIAEVMCATDLDIERVGHDTEKLIKLTEMFLDLGVLGSNRDRSQHYKVQQKFDDLKKALASRIAAESGVELLSRATDPEGERSL